MRKSGIVLLVLAFSLAGPAPALRADEVDDLINGAKPSPLDHAAWALKLLDAAGGLDNKPQARARVYEAAYEHGIKNAKGYPAAIRGARGVIAALGDPKAGWGPKLLTACKLDAQAADRKRQVDAGKIYVYELIAAGDDLGAAGDVPRAAGFYAEASRLADRLVPTLKDEVSWKTKDLLDRQKVQRELAHCEEMLAANPANVNARERSIFLHLIELGDPAKAQKLLTPEVSQDLRTRVPLAAKEPAALDKAVCSEMGDWYAKLAVSTGTTAAGTARALSRAKQCYEVSVKIETDAVKLAAAKLKVDEIDKKLRGPLALPGSDWVYMLAGKEQVQLKEGKSIPDGLAIGSLGTAQDVSVPFAAEFIAKTDSTNIRLGFGGREVVIFNWELDADQLRLVDLADGTAHGLKGCGRIPTDQWVRIILNVTDGQMEVTVDGQSKGKLAGNYGGLSGKLTIASSQGSVVTVNSFRLRQDRRAK